ncbi:MAG TPA: carbonic anhydrase family protein [Candidatus Saccharimonadales bacterium]|nr:carbonic anhydrase family protein [Candidatus Saccharimonadales bacterium]
MSSKQIFRLASVLLFFFSLAPAIPAQSKPPAKDAQPEAHDAAPLLFAYDNGPFGQSTWPGVCNDKELRHYQAPINIIPPSAPHPGLDKIEFLGYDLPTPLTIKTTNPHNLKVYTSQKNKIIKIKDLGTYRLDEFHFHRPSEEAINNSRYPMVIHLVHSRDACLYGQPDCVVVIAVLVEEGIPTRATSALLTTLFQHFPPPALENGVSSRLDGLLPTGYENAGYYRYPGSLTTPPCTENITFFMLKTPVRFSAKQINEFAKRYPSPNARDIQDLNGRPIESR